MDKVELAKVLDLHGKWLRGEEGGVRANLSDADLRNANLFRVKNKEIFCFSAGQHFGYYCDGFIKIGCEYRKVEEWIEGYVEIGVEGGYTHKEIERYGKVIKLIKEIYRE